MSARSDGSALRPAGERKEDGAATVFAAVTTPRFAALLDESLAGAGLLREEVALDRIADQISRFRDSLLVIELAGSSEEALRGVEKLRGSMRFGSLLLFGEGGPAVAHLNSALVDPGLLRLLLMREVERVELQRTLHAFREPDGLALRGLATFMSGLAHDLRSPLNAVIGFAELLARKVHGELNEKQLQYLRFILSSARDLLDLIAVVAELPLLEERAVQPAWERLAWQSFLEAAIAPLRKKAAERSIQLDIDSKDSPAFEIEIDRGRLETAMDFLFTSLIAWTPAGSVLSLESEGSHDSVSLRVKAALTATNGATLPHSDPLSRLPGWQSVYVKRVLALHGGGLETSWNQGEQPLLVILHLSTRK